MNQLSDSGVLPPLGDPALGDPALDDPARVYLRLVEREARAAGELTLRVSRRARLVAALTRPVLLRVDLREGLPVCESSMRAPPLRAARFDAFRSAVWPAPTLRSLALTPTLEVSIASGLRGLRARLGFAGFALRCCSALNCSALVAIISS